jgi:hypothetical protein
MNLRRTIIWNFISYAVLVPIIHALTELLHIPQILGEHAIVSWVDDKIAETFGVAAPTLDQVIVVMVNWGPPAALALLCLSGWIVALHVFTRRHVPLSVGQLPSTVQPHQGSPTPTANIARPRFDAHIGHTYSTENNMIITKAIQISATNFSGHEIQLEDAYVLSEQGKKIAVTVKTSDGYLHPSEITAIAPGRSVTFYAEFNAPHGIPAREFFNEWKVIYLTAKYDGVPHTTIIDEKMVAALYQGFRPNPIEPGPVRRQSAETLHSIVGEFARHQASPLQIIFDPTNPARRFWSLEAAKDKDGSPGPGSYWEHRVEVRNNSQRTLRNVSVTTEHLGQLPMRPADQMFDKTQTTSCDLKPGCSELVPVVRWPNPKVQAGMLADRSAVEYGPIKVTASADDTVPCVRTFKFDYQTEQMLFD